MGILSKDIIEKWILPHLPVGKRGFSIGVPLEELVECILHRLKTGCQWRELPTRQFFVSGRVLDWTTVYYHFNKWSKAGCWEKIWISILMHYQEYLDLSSIEIDGSHTPAKNGGEAVGYQGRKACKTSNALFISDSQGVMLAMSTPQEGQHHDLFEIQSLFDELCTILKEAGIDLEGLFLNADAGFDSEGFKEACQKEDIFPNVKPNPRNSSKNEDREPYQNGTHIFDEKLYEKRTVIEHANAWIDGFKALLVRFEFKKQNWVALHYIAFVIIFLRKINKLKKV
mgnify:CR=1 FL=1